MKTVPDEMTAALAAQASTEASELYETASAAVAAWCSARALSQADADAAGELLGALVKATSRLAAEMALVVVTDEFRDMLAGAQE